MNERKQSFNKLKAPEMKDGEMYFEEKLERAVDIIDLRNEAIDIFLKINILNTGKSICTNDENRSLQEITDAAEWHYKENETFFYFRRRDLLS